MNFFGPLLIHYKRQAAVPESAVPESAVRDRVETTQSELAPGLTTKTGDISLTNIVKMIPGDVVAIYLTARGAVPETQTVLGLRWPFFLTVACLVVCFVLRYFATRAGSSGPNWPLILVTCIAFFIWAHAIYPKGPGPIFPDLYGSVAGVIAMLLGIVAPKFVPAVPDS